MGYKIVREMRKRIMRPNLKSVWIAMGDHAHDADGTGCCAGQETLAWETGYSVRQIGTIQTELELIGAIIETQKSGNGFARHHRMNLDAVPIDPRSTRPEKISGQVARAEEQTGNLCTSDRKSLQPDRKSTASRPEEISYKPSENPLPNPERKNPHSRARESREIDLGIDKIMSSDPDSEAGKRETPVFRRGVDNISATASAISNLEVERRRAARKKELEEQKLFLQRQAQADDEKRSLEAGQADVNADPRRVAAPAGKYDAFK